MIVSTGFLFSDECGSVNYVGFVEIDLVLGLKNCMCVVGVRLIFF